MFANMKKTPAISHDLSSPGSRSPSQPVLQELLVRVRKVGGEHVALQVNEALKAAYNIPSITSVDMTAVQKPGVR